jgi:hypothetical protein
MQADAVIKIATITTKNLKNNRIELTAVFSPRTTLCLIFITPKAHAEDAIFRWLTAYAVTSTTIHGFRHIRHCINNKTCLRETPLD